MIKKIVLVVVALLAALLIYAATLPDTFRVQRSATIKAPPEKVLRADRGFQRAGHPGRRGRSSTRR